MKHDEFSVAYNKIFISFSGGKDSVASYIEVIKQYPKHIVNLIFCDTGDELPETYEYIRYFNDKIHPVTRIASVVVKETNGRRKFDNVYVPIDTDRKTFREKYHTVWDEIRQRNRSNPNIPPFPSNGIRHCTTTLKVNVFEKFVRSVVPLKERGLCLVVIGLRKEESYNRKDTPDMNTDIINGWDIWYPIANFSLADVLDSHKENNIKVNPSYQLVERSNCIGCSFNSLYNIKRVVEKYGVEIIQEWIDLEDETGYTFKNGYSIRDYEKYSKENVLEVKERCNSGFCEF